jgi:hypothetical protein
LEHFMTESQQNKSQQFFINEMIVVPVWMFV